MWKISSQSYLKGKKEEKNLREHSRNSWFFFGFYN